MSAPTDILVIKNRLAWRSYGRTYTPNALVLDSSIPWDAKGAFAWLSLAADDDEFEVTGDSLAAAGPRGRDHAREMIRVLEQHGWVTRYRTLGPTGRPVMVYELHPAPVPPGERTYRPSVAKRRIKLFTLRPARERLDGQVPEEPARPPVQAPAADQPQHQPPAARPAPDRAGGLTTSPDREKTCMHADLWHELNTAGVVIDPAGQRAVGPHITEALAKGWSIASLARHVLQALRDASDRVRNRPGFAVALLRELPDPPKTYHQHVHGTLPPACAACVAENPAAAKNPRFRVWRDPVTGETQRDPLTGDKRTCPNCHPDAPALASAAA